MGRDPAAHAAGGRSSRGVGPLLIGALVLAFTTACTKEEVDQAKAFGLPPAGSDRATSMGALWVGSWIAALIIGLIVWALILWAAFRFRRREPDQVPVQTRYHLPIEVLYTIVPLVIIAVLFFFTVETQGDALRQVRKPDHQMLVVGQKWSWTFSYLDESSLGGNTDVYETGTPAQPPTLWLPVNESVRFTLRSPDVIHSFWVPAFYFKMDVIPGRSNNFDLTPDRTGVFRGRCAELCGTYHSRMLFTVRIVPRAQFEQHLAQLRSIGQIGAPTGRLNQVGSPGAGTTTSEEGSRQ